MNALADFLAHYNISVGGPARRMLGTVAAAFARLPYENITKIIKRAESGNCERARRYPEEVIRNHIDWGTGGTCFSLTSAFVHLVRSMGWEAEYILADRRYGPDTHCALLLWMDGEAHLLDPGYLIVDPIPVCSSGPPREYETDFNRLVLAPEGNAGRISLFTAQGNARTYRLTYKTSPVDAGEFYAAWDASFDWDMMRYPLLTRIAGSRQIYLKGSRIQIRGAGTVESRKIPSEDLIARIAAEFSIHPSVVARALSILKDGGEIAAAKS
jgi:arylamine N-acetyltransferase